MFRHILFAVLLCWTITSIHCLFERANPPPVRFTGIGTVYLTSYPYRKPTSTRFTFTAPYGYYIRASCGINYAAPYNQCYDDFIYFGYDLNPFIIGARRYCGNGTVTEVSRPSISPVLVIATSAGERGFYGHHACTIQSLPGFAPPPGVMPASTTAGNAIYGGTVGAPNTGATDATIPANAGLGPGIPLGSITTTSNPNQLGTGFPTGANTPLTAGLSSGIPFITTTNNPNQLGTGFPTGANTPLTAGLGAGIPLGSFTTTTNPNQLGAGLTTGTNTPLPTGTAGLGAGIPLGTFTATTNPNAQGAFTAGTDPNLQASLSNLASMGLPVSQPNGLPTGANTQGALTAGTDPNLQATLSSLAAMGLPVSQPNGLPTGATGLNSGNGIPLGSVNTNINPNPDSFLTNPTGLSN